MESRKKSVRNVQRQLAFFTDGKTKIRGACGRNSTGFFMIERYTDKENDALFCIAFCNFFFVCDCSMWVRKFNAFFIESFFYCVSQIA